MTIKPRSLKLCKNCRDWSDCIGKPYYLPEDLEDRYCRLQMLWFIDEFVNVDSDNFVIERDTWPNPESGYYDARLVISGVSSHAPYELVRQITGDLLSRLKKTGKDGKMLVLEVHKLAHLNSEGNYSFIYMDLSTDARWALGYVSGFRAKRQSFSQWKYKKRHSKEEDKVNVK